MILRVLITPEVKAASVVQAAPLVKQVLVDAIAEFIANRTPAEFYVNKRYQGQTDDWLIAKVAEVRRRIRAAEALRRAIWDGSYDCG